MRKLLSLLLVFSILLSVTGCEKTQQNIASDQLTSTQPSTEKTTLPTGNDVIQQQPLYAISLMPHMEETMDDNGKVRFVYSFQNLALVLPEPEVADKIILEHLTKLDQADQYAEELRSESLLEEYSNLQVPFLYYISYSPKRFDTAILSMHEDVRLQTGGSHPNTYGHFYTYDLLTGETLKLSDVLTNDTTAEKLTDTVIAALADTEGLIPSYEDTIKDMFKTGLEEYKYWYFSVNGLCFHFDPYVLASYAAGPITAELPYSQLTGILKDEYFPSERDSYRGDLVVEEFTVDGQADYTQFAEAVLSEGGEKILLSADGLITDIKIEAIEIENSIATTVMAARSLSPGDALMVEFDPATTKLLVRYNGGDRAETKTITCNDEKITVS